MKAVVRTEYGPPHVVRIAEVPKPVPADGEVLVKVVAASLNGSDREGVTGRPAYARLAGFRKPRHQILGSDFAGLVAEVGQNVRDVQPGDAVLGEVPGYHSAFAEYVCVPAGTPVPKPPALTFEEAAAIPQAGAIAFQAMRTKGMVQPGQSVLINGAGGAAGSFAVQLAKLCGAEVTAVDSGDKEDFLRSLGADHVIDYTREDFTQSQNQYDLALDLIAHRSVLACARALRPKGTYFIVGGATRALFGSLLLGPPIKLVTGKSVRVLVVPQHSTALRAITELCADRTIVPAIDRRYPLERAPEALRYVCEGRQRGKVMITFATA